MEQKFLFSFIISTYFYSQAVACFLTSDTYQNKKNIELSSALRATTGTEKQSISKGIGCRF